MGYWANWAVSDGFDIRLRDVDERYDTILVAFAEGDTDAHLTFIPVPSLYSSPEEFRADVDYLKSRGHTVLISVGGAEGSFPMETTAQRDECVNSLKEIIDFYHFDGFDIDLEGGRIALDAGDTDLQNPTTPKILNWIEAIREVHSYMESQGKDPVITITPEVAYVQGGLRSYSGIWGAYLPVIHGAREFITSVNVQYYNTAGMYGLDGKLYTPSTDNPDFLVAMTDMLIEGFHPLGSETPFLPLREDQIGFGYPVWDGTPIPTIECVKKALNYIVAGESYGGDYVLSNPDGHLNFRGVFHWNINWDNDVWDYGYIAQLRPLIDGFNEKSCQCVDGLDNDGDGLVDMDDPGCLSSGDNDEYNAPPQCDDGIDNDGDGVVDMEDPDCECATDNSEGPEPIPAWSGNGIPYSVGDLVSYQGNIYSCVSEHASLPNWDPIHAYSLWEEQEGTPPPTPIVAPTAIPARTATPPSIPDPTVPAVPSPTPIQVSPGTGYSVSGSRILGNDGEEVRLYGVNWFGFETENHVPHGLWTRNWQSMIEQIKGLGFNAIRLPICPDTLRGVTPTSIDYYANQDLSGKNSLELLDMFMDEFSREGIYVLLDHHRPDCNAISELWYTDSYSEENWIDDLVFLADRYADNTHLIGLDIKNEPHGAATWGTGNNATDFNKAAERAAAAILAVNPDILIFVEGIETNPVCSGTVNHWWGGNLEPQNCYPLDIPADRLVFSPHVYGPDVWAQPYFDDPAFPDNLPAIWDAHFGYLADAGKSVIPGEFGGQYGHGGDPNDIIWQDAIVDYFLEKNITNFFYWSWNPNSGDTGGILQNDWTTVWEDKVDLLRRLMGSTPAPTPPIISTPIPVISPTPASQPSPVEGDLKIQYWASSVNPTDNQVCPQFNIVNTGAGAVALSELTIRYWFTVDGEEGQSFWCDWAGIGSGNVTGEFHRLDSPASGADYYLEIEFTPGAGSIPAGGSSGEIQCRFSKDDWSNYDESDDYSYNPGLTAFADWSRVTLHRNGSVIWGVAPGGTVPTPASTPTAAPTGSPNPNPTATPGLPVPTITAAQPSATPINTPAPPSDYRVIGYYPNWAIYRNPVFRPESIAADKITHINYAFANHDTSGNIILFDPWADTGYGEQWQDPKPYWGNFRQLFDLKQENPHLKVLISIGGWTLSNNFSPMAADPAARTNFTRSCIEFCEEYDCFDGVDLDWEYPGFEEHNGHPEDTENFTLLLEEMHAAFKSHDPPLLLTIAAPAGPWNYENMEVSQIHQYLDWINLMTYDLHGAWNGDQDAVTNHHSALYPTDRADVRLNTDSTVQYYRSQGVPDDKLVMGIPFYGRSFAEAGSTSDGLYSTYSGEGSQTTEETGFVFFYDIKENRLSTHTRYWDDDCKVPYLHNENPQSPLYLDFISYEDEESIGIKCDYIKVNGLGGAMVWELGLDTWQSGNWDALSVIDTKLKEASVPTPTPAAGTTPSPTAIATPEPNPTKTPAPEPTTAKTPIPPIPTATIPSVPTVTPKPTAAPIVTPTPGSSIGFPEQVFAPYVDVCIYPRFFITEQNQAMGAKYYTLAFVVSDSRGNGIPTWGGYMEYVTSGDWYRDEINGIRERGGDVIVSFGGEAGIELAMAHDNVESLRAAYQSVIDTYNLTWVDFDIEGAAVADSASIDRRNKAIKLLQDDNPNLKVVFCLPVIPSGLTLDGMNLLRNAIANGVRVDAVNIMAMYFGASAPNPDGRMGEYAIEAANSLFDQLKTLYPGKDDRQLWQMVGVTPVIGRSTATEVFYLEDARKLVTFGLEKNINLLSMWSANRDNGSCGTVSSYSPLCSSLAQEDFAFSKIFDQFTGQSGPPAPTPIATATPVETATPFGIPTSTIPSVPSPTPGDPGTNDLIILYRCQEPSATAQSIRPWFELVNNTDSIVDLDDVTLRYWYTADGAGEQQFLCDWAAIGGENIQGEFISLGSSISDADYYLELGFAAAAGALAPGAGTGPIQLRFNRSDWTSYDQSNDYSFAPQFSSYGESLTVTGYLDGNLIFGAEPGGSQTPPPTPGPSSTPAPTVKIPTPTPASVETPAPNSTATPKPNPTETGTPVPEPTATVQVTVPATPKPTATGQPAPTPSPEENPVKVFYRNRVVGPTDNQIVPDFNIANASNTTVALSELTIRYWFTVDGERPQNFWCDWARIGSDNVTGEFHRLGIPLAEADYYLEVGFTAGAGFIPAGSSTGEIQCRFAKDNWTDYNENDDYSYNQSQTSFAESERITLYRDGVLVWGNEPPTTDSPTSSSSSLPVIADGDYNGDGASDIALFRPSSGLWAIRGITRCYFGTGEDIPASGDYNGDGTAQIAIFRPATGLWSIKDQGTAYFGGIDDTPVPADYNGDGENDIAIYRSGSGIWAVNGFTRTYFGGSDYIPLPGDYNGDGTANIAVFRPETGRWSVKDNGTVYFGGDEDVPVPADYNGDGEIDIALFRPATGLWAIKDLTRSYFGTSNDAPVPADYDGDGDDDIALFRETAGYWAVRGVTRAYYGSSGDIPVAR